MISFMNVEKEKTTKEWQGKLKVISSFLLIALTMLFLPKQSLATNNYFGNLQTAFPQFVGTAQDECGFCHFSWTGAQTRNDFGITAYMFLQVTGGMPAALAHADLLAVDSDGDGRTNDQEINNTDFNGQSFPGYPGSADYLYNQYHFRSESAGVPTFADSVSDNMKGSSVIPPNNDTNLFDPVGEAPDWNTNGTPGDATATDLNISNLSVASTGANDVTLNWTSPGGDASRYDIRFTTSNRMAAVLCEGASVPCDVTNTAHWEEVWDITDSKVDGGAWNDGVTNTPTTRVLWEPHPDSGGGAESMLIEPTGFLGASSASGIDGRHRPWSATLSTYLSVLTTPVPTETELHFAIRVSDGVFVTDTPDDATAVTQENLSDVVNVLCVVVGTGACGGGDSTAPAVGTSTLVSGSYTSGSTWVKDGFVFKASATDAVGVTGCAGAIDNATYSVGASWATDECTTGAVSLAAETSGNSLTLNMQASDAAANTGTGTSLGSIIVDKDGPASTAFTATAGPDQCSLAWTIADAHSGLVATPFEIRYSTAAFPGTCGAGTLLNTYSSATSADTDSGAVNPNTYYYTMCSTDNLGNTTATNASTSCAPTAGGDASAPLSVTAPTFSLGTATHVPGTTTGGFTYYADINEPDSTPTCTYWDGSGWVGGNISVGGTLTHRCTTNNISSADTGAVNVPYQVKGTSAGGTTDGTIGNRKVDNIAPASATFSATAGNNKCDLAWTTGDGSGSGVVAADGYEVRWNQTATAPVSCAADSQLGTYSSATAATSDTGAVNPNTYSYRLCATDEVGNISEETAQNCQPTAGPSTSALTGASAGADVTSNSNSAVLLSTFQLLATGAIDTVTTITVDRAGAGLVDGDFAAIDIYSDGGTLGIIDGGDASIGSASLSGGSILINITDEALAVGVAENFIIRAALDGTAPGADGTATFNVSAIASGNGTGSSDSGEATLTYDGTAPTTTVNTGPSTSTWYAANQAVTLNEIDTGGSGVDTTDYCVQPNGSNCTPGTLYGASIAVNCGAGSTCLLEVGYATTDLATNLQAPQYLRPIWIDKEGPSINSFSGNGSDSQCNINWNTSDAGSGLGGSPVTITYQTGSAPGCGAGTALTGGNPQSAINSDTATGLSNGTPYYFTLCVDDNMSNQTIDNTVVCTPAATQQVTIGDGAGPSDSFQLPSASDVYISEFTMATNSTTANITDVTITKTGTAAITASSVKIWTGGVGSTLEGSGNFGVPIAITQNVGTGGTTYQISVTIDGAAADASSVGADVSAISTDAPGGGIDNDNVDATLTVDSAGPGGTAFITDDTGGFNPDNLVNVTITCNDGTGSGCASMRVSNSSTYADAGWEAVANKTDWPLTDVEGPQTVYVWYKDNLGNVTGGAGGDASDSTYIDKTGPSGSVTIGAGFKPYTNSSTLDSTISGVSDGTGAGCTDIETSQTGAGGWSSIGNCTGPINTWTHGCGEGSCDIFVRFKDAVGNYGSNASDVTTYDTTQPTATTDPAHTQTNVPIAQLITVTFANGPIDCTTVTANGTVSISGAGCQAGNLTKDSCNDTDAVFSHPNFTIASSCTLDVSVGNIDKAGNALAAPVSSDFTVSAASESTPPNFATTVGGSESGDAGTVTISWGEATDPAEAGSTPQADIKYDICQTQTSGACDGGSFVANAASNVAGVGTDATITQDILSLNVGEKYYFKIKAKDLSGNPTIHATEIGSVPYDRQLGVLGYNMVGVPGEMGGGLAPASIFDTTNETLSYLRIMGWSGGYTIPALVEEGYGYWLLNRTGDTTTLIDTGTASADCGSYATCYTPQAAAVTVALGSGWNLVSNPCLTNVTGTDIEAPSGTTLATAVTNSDIKNTVYRWNGTNYTTDAPTLTSGGNMLPWSGYWMFVIDNAAVPSITITCGAQ